MKLTRAKLWRNVSLLSFIIGLFLSVMILLFFDSLTKTPGKLVFLIYFSSFTLGAGFAFAILLQLQIRDYYKRTDKI